MINSMIKKHNNIVDAKKKRKEQHKHVHKQTQKHAQKMKEYHHNVLKKYNIQHQNNQAD